ncbi:RNA polymerase II transcription factor SIII [Salix suchowensis]|nr:RNA polymerase II transcription factor SIII [Salix suchowensis]
MNTSKCPSQALCTYANVVSRKVTVWSPNPHLMQDVVAIAMRTIEDANPVGGPKVLIRALGAYAVQSHFELEVEPKKLRESETRRLEELAHKMRKQRTAAEDKKEERKVKFTDRLPPAASKRSGCKATYIQVTGPASDITYRGINPQPKTLFQKTKSEAFKLQRTMYSFVQSLPWSMGRLIASSLLRRNPAVAYLNLNAIVKPCHCNDSATRSTATKLF